MADAIIVAPATYNTINKWANGISDNYALGILAEAVGLRIPVVVLRFVNTALASHPAFQRSIALLRDAGIDVIHGPGRLEPHPPGTGGSKFDMFPWHQALDEAETFRRQHEQSARQQQDAPRAALSRPSVTRPGQPGERLEIFSTALKGAMRAAALVTVQQKRRRLLCRQPLLDGAGQPAMPTDQSLATNRTVGNLAAAFPDLRYIIKNLSIGQP